MLTDFVSITCFGKLFHISNILWEVVFSDICSAVLFIYLLVVTPSCSSTYKINVLMLYFIDVIEDFESFNQCRLSVFCIEVMAIQDISGVLCSSDVVYCLLIWSLFSVHFLFVIYSFLYITDHTLLLMKNPVKITNVLIQPVNLRVKNAINT